MNKQQAYEARQRAAGNTTVAARLTAEQAAVIKTAGGPTSVLRAIADAILAGGEVWIISGEGEIGTVMKYDGPRTLPAIRQHLGHERAGGDRWARGQVFVHAGQGGPVYMDVETAELS